MDTFDAKPRRGSLDFFIDKRLVVEWEKELEKQTKGKLADHLHFQIHS